MRHNGPAVLYAGHSGVGSGSSDERREGLARESDLGHEILYLGNIERAVDRLQELFDVWEAEATFGDRITPQALNRARLALHEWVANLIQHADFQSRVPEVALSLWVRDGRLWCVVTDNSIGFDPTARPRGEVDAVSLTLPERGMGLLLLQASVEELRYYCPVDRHYNRLEFAVS